MMFNALGTHELQTGAFCAEIGDGFSFVFVAGYIVREIGLHIFDSEGLLHLHSV
jgi:hypothetical protein